MVKTHLYQSYLLEKFKHRLSLPNFSVILVLFLSEIYCCFVYCFQICFVTDVRCKTSIRNRRKYQIHGMFLHGAMTINTKRMHSSRMRTGRSLTVCRSLLPGWGRSAPRGGLLLGGSAIGGVFSWGSAIGGICAGGVSAPGEGLLPGGIPACTEADPPCEQNDKLE